jgi:hypothetical protein
MPWSTRLNQVARYFRRIASNLDGNGFGCEIMSRALNNLARSSVLLNSLGPESLTFGP